ncbi:MAG: ABC transporter ATP-binding protein, partial [Gammaproteobacteria bacterium]|nr:ABC transporter ATP-binding protein [Gammaproteobacteria bacterium]
DAPMEAIGERYVEVLVDAGHLDTARALKPIDERALPFGKTVMLFDRGLFDGQQFDGKLQPQLDALGETRTPGLADLFVAIMKGTYA